MNKLNQKSDFVAMIDFANARLTMIENQLRTYDVLDYNTLEAMGAMPRELFVPEHMSPFAYLDRAVPVGGNRELMTPMVFGRLLQAMGVRKTDRVLDIAGATGYSAAVFATMAADVIALEDDAELSRKAKENFAKLGLDNVTTDIGPIEKGAKSGAPFNLIFVNGAIETEPTVLLGQLAEGGCLGCIQGSGRSGRAVIYRRNFEHFTALRIFDGSAVSLKAFSKPLEFSF